MKKRYVKRIITIILCVLEIVSCPNYVKAANTSAVNDETSVNNKQVVKVAYYRMGDYYTIGSGGNIISYDTEMLAKISDYSNLEFQYVDCGTWSDALDMLEKHEVDLVGTAQWNDEREQKYEFCLEGYGYTVGEMATLPDKEIIYEDYAAIGTSVIGCTYNYVRMAELQNVFDENGIHPRVITYDTQEQLENALNNGEIDIIAANSHTLKSSWNIVEKFSFSPYFFMSWKGNSQLTDAIDLAIIKIQLQDPNLDDEVLNKYFPDILGEPLTKKEIELINKGNTYNVYYSADIKPLAWYDAETDSMKGVLIDACRQITQTTGLRINVRPEWEASNGQQTTTLKYTTLFSDFSVDISKEAGVTDAIITEPFNLYVRSGQNIDLSDESGYTIAFVGKRNLLESYIMEKYPECNVISCSSPKECIEKLKSGEANLAYLSVHIADNYLTEMGIDDIRELPVDEQFNGIGLYFQGEDSEILESIVNKGIRKINQTEISNAMVEYALSTDQKLTWRIIVRDYMGICIAVAATLVVLLLLMVFLGTYANVMRKQKDKVERADADRSEFFARMSHDMRTPMNGILGMIELSKDTTDVNIIHDNLDKAKASSEYMLSLINDTLDLQKLETGKMNLQSDVVYTKDYFDGIFSMLKMAADKKGVQFRITNVNICMDEYVEIDKIRVKQIFTNILSNAIKFTPTGGLVEVVMECLGTDNDISHEKFQIRDTGVGMSEDFINNKIFKPYAQENSKITSELTGTGLGLAITKNLVDVMGGEIEVRSELGEGTTFTIYLDFKNVSGDAVVMEQQKRSDKAERVQMHLDGIRILLCEDHPLNAEISKKILERAGCQVTWVENGKDGVETFANSQINYYSAILMDIRMPVMDGIEATMRIRGLDRSDAGSVPIIAMTANAYDSDRKQSAEAGMNAHLAKPVEPEIMYETIANLVKVKR